jgi:hypothetical protein
MNNEVVQVILMETPAHLYWEFHSDRENRTVHVQLVHEINGARMARIARAISERSILYHRGDNVAIEMRQMLRMMAYALKRTTIVNECAHIWNYTGPIGSPPFCSKCKMEKGNPLPMPLLEGSNDTNREDRGSG